MPSRRQAILEAWIALLQTIRTANDFETDVGAQLFLGDKSDLGPNDPSQALALDIGDEDSRWQGPGKALFCTMLLHNRALASGDLEQPFAMSETIVADIKKCIEGTDPQLGGLLMAPMERGPVVMLPREEGSTTVGASVIYRVQWKEKWGAP
jgi:hypothetical protein